MHLASARGTEVSRQHLWSLLRQGVAVCERDGRLRGVHDSRLEPVQAGARLGALREEAGDPVRGVLVHLCDAQSLRPDVTRQQLHPGTHAGRGGVIEGPAVVPCAKLTWSEADVHAGLSSA